MNYQEFKPKGVLKEFIQCYFICETETEVDTDDNVFASGFLEIMFNLGATRKQFKIHDRLVVEPDIQLWGQVLKPLQIKSYGKHAMFGIRFFPHTAAFFLNENIEHFNDAVFDLEDVIGNKIKELHSKLVESNTISQKIALSESFLLPRLLCFEKKTSKLNLINSVSHELLRDDCKMNMNRIASSHGISSRYLQTIFLQYSGLTPNLFRKINRFQKSLYLLAKNNDSLTSIAHYCGYFDQSHFIKDFKEFTGSTPSSFQPESSTELMAFFK